MSISPLHVTSYWSFTRRGDMTRHGTVRRGNIQLIKTREPENASHLCIRTLSRRWIGNSGALWQETLAFAAAKSKPPPSFSALRLRHDELLIDILQLHFPSASSAGIASSSRWKWDKNNGFTATKQAVKAKTSHSHKGAMFRIKTRNSKDRCFGSLDIWSHYGLLFSFIWCVMSLHCYFWLSQCSGLLSVQLGIGPMVQYYGLSSSYFQGLKYFTILAQDSVGKNVFGVWLFFFTFVI